MSVIGQFEGKNVAIMALQWLSYPVHVALVLAVLLLYLIAKALCRIHDLLDEFHDDFREVHHLDDIAEQKMLIGLDDTVEQRLSDQRS